MLWNLLENVRMKIGHYTVEGSGRLLEESQCEKNLEVFECKPSQSWPFGHALQNTSLFSSLSGCSADLAELSGQQ